MFCKTHFLKNALKAIFCKGILFPVSYHIVFLFIFLLLLIVSGCKEDTPVYPKSTWKRDSRIQQVTYYGYYDRPDYYTHYFPVGDALFPCTIYDNIYYIKRIRDDAICNKGIWCINVDTSLGNNKLNLLGNYGYLYKSRYTNEFILIKDLHNLHSGELLLYNLDNNTLTPVNTELNAIYGAVFADNDSSLIIYGEKIGAAETRGYYKYSRNNQTLRLLFTEPMGFYGFDVSPNNEYLIYPVHPKYCRYNLHTAAIDTGQVFAQYLRFSPDGKKIVYSDNTIDLYDGSEVGIINYETGVVEKLNIELADPALGYTYVGQPAWLMDGSAIIFSGVPIAGVGCPGPLGPPNIYIYHITK